MSNSVLAVVGSANMDLVFYAPSFPQPGQTVMGTGFMRSPGGKGANQAVAAARLGAPVEFVGKLGTDPMGAELRAHLERSGVSTKYLLLAETAPTGTAGITVTEGGENMIVVISGANSHLYGDEVEEALGKVSPAITLTQFEINEDAAEGCLGADRLIVNPAPARYVPPQWWASVEMITPNRREAEALTGVSVTDQGSCALCANRLLELGVKVAVITLGDQGSFLATASMSHFIPTFQVRPVDTTGAGDCFNGALAAFLLEGRDLVNAVTLANTAAAISTTRAGAQASMPTRDELASLASNLL